MIGQRRGMRTSAFGSKGWASPRRSWDGQIAAIAVSNGLPIVTANPRDFRAFKGLRVLNWANP